MVTCKKVFIWEAPREMEASSMLGLIWPMMAVLDRMV